MTGLGGSAKRAGSVPQIRPGGYPRSDFFETWLGSQKRGKDSQLGHSSELNLAPGEVIENGGCSLIFPCLMAGGYTAFHIGRYDG